MGRALLLCVASAVLYFLTFLDFGLYPLIWFCFVPVLYAIRDATPRRALLLGTVFGAITNAGGYYWVVHTIQTFENLNIIVATLGYALLCVYQGFLLAIVLALVRFGERNLRIAPVWSLAIVFPALELAYPLLFPSYIGNSQLNFHAITQFVDITGMAGAHVADRPRERRALRADRRAHRGTQGFACRASPFPRAFSSLASRMD